MRTAYIVGWKTYLAAIAAILAGAAALFKGNVGDGLKGIIGGAALIGLRDAAAKILRAIEDNREALTNMRGALDTHWPTTSRTSRG